MTSYEYEYETVEEPRRHRSHRHRKDDREPRYADEPRYVETQETYIRSAATKSPVAYAPDAPVRERERERDREVTQTRELVRQPRREDSDLSVEEVRRDFPPPAAGGAYIDQRTTVREARYGPPARRSRSVGRDGRYGEYLSDSRGDPRRSFQELDRRDDYYEDAELEDKRSLSRNQKIAAAVGGAALAVGAKELWDRRSAEGRPVERNPLASAMVGAAGALAAYEGTELYDKHGNKEKKVKKYAVHRGRNGEVQETYYSEEEEEIKPEKKKGRRKSIVDSAMALAGLGAAAKGVEHHRGRRGSGDSYYEESTSRKSRSKSRSGEGTAKYQQAAKAALLAGAAEAFRVRNEPGAWGGEKGKRILTAAIGAGGIDAAIDKDADKKSKRHILEAVVGGLVGNRAINGSRKDVEEDPVTGRSRSRSRARSRARSSSRGGGGGGGTGLAALATAGLGAIAGKKLLDRSRSRSRAGSRSRARSHSRGRRDSYSRSPSPDRNKRSRSKSVSAMARKGLAALGIGAGAGAAANEVGRNRDRSRSRNRDDYDDYSDYDDRSRRTRGQRGDVYGNPRYSESRGSVDSRGGARARDGQRNKKVAEGKNGYTSDDSLISSSEDERRVKKMKARSHRH